MKNYRMINVNNNECVSSGNIAFILEDFKARNYPYDIKIVNEDDEVIIAANEDYNIKVEMVRLILEELCKRCSKCGRLLPKEAFNKKTKSSDGLQDNCKDCMRAYNKERYDRMKIESDKAIVKVNEYVDLQHLPQKLHKIYSNPDLARFTPRELMAELKTRGFKWEYMLEPQKKIMFDKI